MYQPPPAMQFNPVNFGSLAPNPMQLGMQIAQMNRPQGGQQPTQGGIFGAIQNAMSPSGGPQGQADPTSSTPPQMGMLSGLLQKLGMGGGGMPSGPAPTALTGMW